MGFATKMQVHFRPPISGKKCVLESNKCGKYWKLRRRTCFQHVAWRIRVSEKTGNQINALLLCSLRLIVLSLVLFIAFLSRPHALLIQAIGHCVLSCFVFGSHRQVWNKRQHDMFKDAEGRRLTLAGDGRADSPGHSAKYGTYTMLDVEKNKVLHVETVQVLNNSIGLTSRTYECANILKRRMYNEMRLSLGKWLLLEYAVQYYLTFLRGPFL